MTGKRIEWLGGSYRDLCAMPDTVRRTFGHALGLTQNGDEQTIEARLGEIGRIETERQGKGE